MDDFEKYQMQDLYKRVEKLEKNIPPPDLMEKVVSVCLCILTFFASCIFIGAFIAIVTRI